MYKNILRFQIRKIKADQKLDNTARYVNVSEIRV